MKKYFFLFLISIPFFQLQAQELNKEITDEGNPFLLGKIDKSGLTSDNYNQWFSENYDNYQVDKSIINDLKTTLNNFTITVFMGTWCGDSKREVPRFYKILEASNFPMHQLTVIALSSKPYMYKQSPRHYEAGLNIHRVPTFIFYKNGKEINRIVEHPVESLEKDMLNITTSNDYESNYQIVTQINTILKNDGLNGLKKQSKKLVKEFKNKVSSMFELNTYGRVLFSKNQKEAAIEVFKINNLLFEEEPRTYMSLANTLGVLNYKKEAIKVLENANKRFPENTDLKENLKIIESY
ncbi:MAG: thioredoxin family protein [Winogradskyella sp.]|uniref:thioredoxin family protein n=1 Tax=Winogradskyella sp. TaxID=1883156 RepID=UPI0025E8B255|nr:thioredoxin family protein [Winogradskyella sp.]NRB60895.1 thioredoxin family protein [Winogradskyella sp.]